MKFMNEYDLIHAQQRFDPYVTPRRAELVTVVVKLADWADHNSDGWAYWPKPCQAAKTAIGHIESRTSRENDEQERYDITDSQFTAALRPIKSFLTRQGVAHSEVIPR